MNVLSPMTADMSGAISAATTREELVAIRRPECAAAIWNRSLPDRLHAWLDALDASLLPRARLILRPDAVRDAAAESCDIAGTAPGPERDLLLDDIATLAGTFADITRARWLRMRLDVITTNACRRFHVDAITARMICTYRGTGTQYGIAEGGSDPSSIHTAPTGSPVVLRGTLWPEQPPSGLLHRSPPVEDTGETRLVFVLDPVDDPEEVS